jgi:hypothetical protein
MNVAEPWGAVGARKSPVSPQRLVEKRGFHIAQMARIAPSLCGVFCHPEEIGQFSFTIK